MENTARDTLKSYDMNLEWFELTMVVTWIQLVLVLLCMLKRPCFLSLVVCLLAIYVLHFPSSITRKTFRGLVAALAFSWAYDFFYFFFLQGSAAAEDEEDGGAEYKLRRFTNLVSFISLLFKVIVIAIFWKDSIDFRRIIRQRDQEG